VEAARGYTGLPSLWVSLFLTFKRLIFYLMKEDKIYIPLSSQGSFKKIMTPHGLNKWTFVLHKKMGFST